jgi:hypothetical protein
MDNALTGGSAAFAYSPKHQTRQTNDLFCTPGLDGRSWQARAYKDVVRGMLRDLGVDQADLSNSARLQFATLHRWQCRSS